MGILLLLFPVYLYMRPAHLLLCWTHNIRGWRRSLPLFFPLSPVVKSHRLIPEPQMIGPWPVLSVSGSPLPPSPAPLYLCCLCWCWEICAGYDRVDRDEHAARPYAVLTGRVLLARHLRGSWLRVRLAFITPPEVCHQVGHRMPRDLQVEFGWR